MAQYRYVGGNVASIYESRYQFTSYGQLVELPDNVAEACLAGRICLLTPKEFDAIHTPEDVQKFSKFTSHANAPQDFLDRRTKAWIAAQARHGQQAQAQIQNAIANAPTVVAEQK